jgi:hypothetical protein
MPSAYDTLRQNVEEKIAQRNAIRAELNAIPGLVAASLALHIGAPREHVLIGHVEADGAFVEGGIEQFAQRVVFAVTLAFNVGEEQDFRLPVKIEAVLHNGGYTLALEGQQAALLARPLAANDSNDTGLRAVAEVLGALLLQKIDAHLGQVT